MTTTIQDKDPVQAPFDVASARIDALYMHVPFCRHKCHYCDFYSIVDHEQRQATFVDALVAELNRWAPQWPEQSQDGGVPPLQPRTIFVGGGTPTLLRSDLWRRLLNIMRRSGVLERVEEFTVEANPESVSSALVGVLAAGGVNRVSLGVQSFHKQLLLTLQREHDPSHAARAVRILRAGGIDRINVDLIFAIPGQTVQMLDADLEMALSLNPQHVSCYNLTYEPNTPMTARMKAGLLSPAPEPLERDLYQRVIERMDAAGFEHYEISNWARRKKQESRKAGEQERGKAGKRKRRRAGNRATAPDPISCSPALLLCCSSSHRCLHNMIYWNNGNWLGLGPAAASHIDGRRWKNKAHLGRYIADSPRPAVVEVERLDPDRQIGEQLMLGLRLLDGVACGWLRDRMRPDDQRWGTIDELIDMGMLQESAGRLRLTRRGLFVADAVMAKLL